MTSGAVLMVRGVEKTFRAEGEEACPALAGIDLAVAPREIVCLMGPSGCGKSTLLRVIGGLERADTGAIEGVASAAMVFQDHALFPWLSVRENIVYGLRLGAQRLPGEEVRARGEELLALTRLDGFARSLPHQLSGGMKQRAAVARALAIRPAILLMDEPFSALDPFTRRELEDEVIRIRDELGTTILMVTHNPEEAVYIADRIVVLSERPAVVAEILAVDLPHPRDPADPAFIALREEVTRLVRTGAGRGP
jgi:ABC-type nitrate/sulfonate/bicarbonate transport system ATPase subunit